MIPRAWVLAGVLLLAGCGEPDPPVQNATTAIDVPPTQRIPEGETPPPSTAPGALPAPELDDVGTALGTWAERDGRALFGPPDGSALLVVTCDADARRVVFQRIGRNGSAATMRAVTATAAASMTARVGEGPPRAVVGSLAADDVFLTSLAAAKDRFGVRVDDDRTLAMPADPAVARVIAACRVPY